VKGTSSKIKWEVMKEEERKKGNSTKEETKV
jgi:hypothetical protein